MINCEVDLGVASTSPAFLARSVYLDLPQSTDLRTTRIL